MDITIKATRLQRSHCSKTTETKSKLPFKTFKTTVQSCSSKYDTAGRLEAERYCTNRWNQDISQGVNNDTKSMSSIVAISTTFSHLQICGKG